MAEREPYDDLETDYLEEENESGILSMMSLVIGFLAVAGFIALAWYAYKSSTEPMVAEDLEVITAGDDPVKVAPEEPGGWQFPHQEKSVYNVVSGEKDEPKVEQILPKDEEPIQRPTADTESWVSDELKQETADIKEKAEDAKVAVTGETAPATAKSLEKPVVESKPEPEVAVKKEEPRSVSPAPIPAPEVKEVVKPIIVDTPKAIEIEEPEVVKAPAPKPVAVQPKSTIAPKPVEAAKAPPPAPPRPTMNAPASTSAAGVSAVRLQLGAYGSEQEAKNSWNKIQGKVGSKLGGRKAHIEYANVGGKDYYRLHLYPFDSTSAAKSLCNNLNASGQACFPVTR